jgi:hypothetical protein
MGDGALVYFGYHGFELAAVAGAVRVKSGTAFERGDPTLALPQ